jgi:hypothetical protein
LCPVFARPVGGLTEEVTFDLVSNLQSSTWDHIGEIRDRIWGLDADSALDGT